MVRLTTSHPDYEEINLLKTMLCYARNPHMLFGVDMDVGEPERKAIIEVLEGELNDLLNDIWVEEELLNEKASVFKDYLT